MPNETALSALLDRAKVATEVDRLLDADIHAALFGTVDTEVGMAYRAAFDRLLWHSGPYHFTGRVEGAEMALSGPEWPEYQITRRFGTGYHASVGLRSAGVGRETAALALLCAALEARVDGGSSDAE
jgi:hypothetical protein